VSQDKETFVADVTHFAELAGCTTDQFNVRQTALYIGLQCEELAEKLDAIFPCGAFISQLMKDLSKAFKEGYYDDNVLNAERETILDADADLAWVTIGSMLSQGADVLGAMKEVERANLDKFPGGVVTKDGNGKVKKPEGWRGPDLSPYVNGSSGKGEKNSRSGPDVKD
jgi:predicted HAD superfamily Cof-like phosphohydrolase